MSENGYAAEFRIGGTDATIKVSVGQTSDTDAYAFWIEALEGRVGFRPKANLALMAVIIAECEGMARQFGCTEMRVEFGTRMGWKARLLPALGFEDNSSVMRKEL